MIKDGCFSHYLGCYVLFNGVRCQLRGVHVNYIVVDFKGELIKITDVENVKLILRPIEDMTIDEGEKIINGLYKYLCGFDCDFDATKKYTDDNLVEFTSFSGNLEMSLTIDTHGGITFSYPNPPLPYKIKQMKIFRQLLSDGFDLFGLIHAGIALDGTLELK